MKELSDDKTLHVTLSPAVREMTACVKKTFSPLYIQVCKFMNIASEPF